MADLVASILTNVASAVETNPDGLLSTVTSAAASVATDRNGIESLLSDAQSLITSVYGTSTTITNLGALTWPSTVVIGSSTYAIHNSGTTFATAVSSSTQTARPATTPPVSNAVPTINATPNNSNQSTPNDKRLGIVIGVVLGAIALAICIFLIWFLHRRNKNTGSFWKRRTSSPSDEEVFNWRKPKVDESYSSLEADGPMQMQQQPMAAHGLFATRSWTHDDDGMHTTSYKPVQYDGPAELAADNSDRGSLNAGIHMETTSTRQDNRPPTPFSPASFAALAATSPVSPIDRENQFQSEHRRSSNPSFWPSHAEANRIQSPIAQPATMAELVGSSPYISDTTTPATTHEDYPHPSYQNPFAHEDDDDDEEYDVGGQRLNPPVIPSRSPRRRSSPVVHYPTGNELGQFDFDFNRRKSESRGWRDV